MLPFIALACLAVAGTFLLTYLFLRAKAKMRSRWPTVSGTVIDSTTFMDQSELGQTALPSITYRYEVAGRTYEGDRIEWSGSLWTGSLDRLNPYLRGARPAGSHVTVYYDPKNPASALLEPAAIGAGEILLVLAAFSGVIGLFLLFSLAFLA